MKRFDIVYLGDVTESQGDLFGYVELNNYDLVEFSKFYLKSDLRHKIDNGHTEYCNYLGKELYHELKLKGSTDEYHYMNTGQWLGELYSMLQWYSSMYSSELVDIIKPSELITRYNGLHDLDMGLAVKKILSNWGLKYYKQ